MKVDAMTTWRVDLTHQEAEVLKRVLEDWVCACQPRPGFNDQFREWAERLSNDFNAALGDFV